MTFAAALAAARSHPHDADVLAELASEALQEGEEEAALVLIDKGLSATSTARLWQWKGLLERSLDEHERALASFAEAARREPGDLSIAGGHARVALEAGIPAEALYERALGLGRTDGTLLTGLAAARFAAGHGETAEAELDVTLAQSPTWIEGHMQLAQLRSMLGRGADASKSLERAISQLPASDLWRALFDLHLKARAFDQLDKAIEQARVKNVPEPLLLPYQAVAAVERGQTDRADGIFAQLRGSGAASLPIWQIRHLLRSGRVEEALPVIDRELRAPDPASAWPYASAAWKLAGDPRSQWLEGDSRLVSVVDLTPRLPPLQDLAAKLRSLHVADGEYLDQSVRGGTQTDGPLLSRIEPIIRQLRSAIVSAVRDHVRQLPPTDEHHPTLRHPRDRRIRFSGSWSVRLRGGGRHANHVHPLGWISSALYVDLPERPESEPVDAGWLTLGEPDASMHLPLAPWRKIEPKPGHLVLFPSWMWHGTLPFAEGERLTVAFDVAVPR